jgi:hypothetical protein
MDERAMKMSKEQSAENSEWNYSLSLFVFFSSFVFFVRGLVEKIKDTQKARRLVLILC